MYDDINLFINLVECGGFAKAAKKLNMHQSTLSRRIEQVEKHLGFKLIKGVSYGSIELTDEGSHLYRTTSSKFVEIHSNIEMIKSSNQTLHGDFKIVIPSFIHMLIGPVINKFLQIYPDINITVSNFNADVSVYESSFDVAFGFIKPRNVNYIISVLYSSSYSFYASDEYLKKHGTPSNLEDLKNHYVIALIVDETPLLCWQALNKETKIMEAVTLKNPKAICDGSVGTKFLALAHQGITGLPDMMVLKEVQEGKLIKVLENYAIQDVDLFMIKTDSNFNAKSAAFIQFIKAAIPTILSQQ